jgi:hypothetical protein
MFFNGKTYRNEIHCRLEEALVAKMRLGRDKTTPEVWILAERLRMLEAVNEERARLGKDPVALSAIERVERCAAGHHDYVHKFALYCTELVEATP